MEDSLILSWYRLSLNFGKEVSTGIKFLAKKDGVDYMKRMRECASTEDITVKLCDRLHNLRSLKDSTKQKQQKYILETNEKYIPLADLLINRLSVKEKWRGIYLKKKIKKECNKY